MAAAMGGYYKIGDGTRVEVVGIAEQGNYHSLAEDPKPAMFLLVLQSPSTETWMVVRSSRDSQQLGPAIRNTLRDLDAGLPVYIQTWVKELDHPLFAPRMATLSLGVLGMMGAMLSITGIFGMAAYSVSKRLKELGIRMALGAQRKEVLQAALGRPFKLLAFGSAAGLLLGILASRVLAFIVYSATPRDPLVLTGVVLAMSLLGLLATWIPAQRALTIDQDRKSTRLNSSHANISYAVFCLKKKKPALRQPPQAISPGISPPSPICTTRPLARLMSTDL